MRLDPLVGDSKLNGTLSFKPRASAQDAVTESGRQSHDMGINCRWAVRENDEDAVDYVEHIDDEDLVKV